MTAVALASQGYIQVLMAAAALAGLTEVPWPKSNYVTRQLLNGPRPVMKQATNASVIWTSDGSTGDYEAMLRTLFFKAST